MAELHDNKRYRVTWTQEVVSVDDDGREHPVSDAKVNWHGMDRLGMRAVENEMMQGLENLNQLGFDVAEAAGFDVSSIRGKK